MLERPPASAQKRGPPGPLSTFIPAYTGQTACFCLNRWLISFHPRIHGADCNDIIDQGVALSTRLRFVTR